MNHQNTGQHVPPHYAGRRQAEYHYQPPSHHPQAHHVPYAYHHPQQYHGGPPMHHYPQQWYQPYPQYAPPVAYRPYQPQSPLVVSSSLHAQPVLPPARHLAPASQPLRPPQLEQSTPSTTSQVLAPPSRSTTPTTASASAPTPPVHDHKQPPVISSPVDQAPGSGKFALGPPNSAPTQRMPFYPQLPWFSVPEESFPPRALRRRRKRRDVSQSSDVVQLPSRPTTQAADVEESTATPQPAVAQPEGGASSIETPKTSIAPSESEYTNPETPASSVPASSAASSTTVQTHKRSLTKPIVPVIPIKPVITTLSNLSPSQQKSPPASDIKSDAIALAEVIVPDVAVVDASSDPAPTSPPPPVRVVPKSWAELLRNKAAAASSAAAAAAVIIGSPATDGITGPKPNTLADALSLYAVDNDIKISFLEPRGLVNTGNMCYMNSILQTLVFCVPFYDFLDQISKRVVHSFKSDMPLVEAMIMFMREFNVVDSAGSVDQLRMRLKENDFDRFGDAFIPEFVYDVIKRLPRFSTMRRGHQQDAEEFLGFLLEGLHDECAHVTQTLGSLDSAALSERLTSPTSESGNHVNGGDSGWLEVGPKQKPSVTRSSGTVVTESPVTKIFGGKLRSEFRVPGLQNSVTLEPYQSLQLDIGDSNVHSITDALRGLTRSETLHGDFRSPRGPNATATKQVFIETLPPVLILHLKRFQYDNTGGTQKIWKKIGYPLELEIPKEVFSPQKRGAYAARPQGLPKYALISVVYHHGKNASGGHYTIDTRRQEGREWIRMDDTVVRRVRSDDVANEGAEEDPKILAKALEQHRRDVDAGRNIYEAAGMDRDADEEDTENGWSQVNGQTTSPNPGSTAKKWANVINGTGTATPSTAGRQTPREKYSVKDNKVAYILFYQRISA